MSDTDEFEATVAKLLGIRPTYEKQFDQHRIVKQEAEQYDKAQADSEGAAQAVAGWIGLNPSDQIRTKQLVDSTYLASASAISTDVRLETGSAYPSHQQDPLRLLPTDTGFKELLKVLMDDIHSMVLLTGYRGAGKSHAMNYFFSKYFETDLKPNGITFFRCDASKLKDIEAKLSGPAISAGPITLMEYLRAHNLYVALKHGSHDPLLKPFDRTIQSQSKANNFLAHLRAKGQNDSAYLFWNEWWNSPHIEPIADELSPIEFMADVISAERNGSLQGSLKVHRMMLNHIKENKGRIILVIDGVDNLSLEADHNRYERLMLELLGFFPHGNAGPYWKIVLSVRVLTYRDLQNRLMHTARTLGQTTFLVGSVGPQAFLNHRIGALKERESIGKKYFAGSPNWDRELIGFSQKLLDNLRAAIGEVGNKSQAADAELMQKIYFGNLRSYRRNLLQAYRYCKNLSWVLGVSLEKISRRIVLEASILGGGLFMPIWGLEDKPLAPGRWCPNLFFYHKRSNPTDPTKEQWDGLHLLRILQLLDKSQNALAVPEVQDQLATDFGYPPDITKAMFLRALRFGLVAFDTTKFVTRVNCHELAYFRSMKGDALLKEVFQSPNMFYMMAASSQIPREWLEDSNKIFLHSPRNTDRQFLQAAMKTGISFWQLLKSEHQREMRGRRFKDDRGSAVALAEFQARYALPDDTVWQENLVKAFRGLQRLSKHDASEILIDLKGRLHQTSGTPTTTSGLGGEPTGAPGRKRRVRKTKKRR